MSIGFQFSSFLCVLSLSHPYCALHSITAKGVPTIKNISPKCSCAQWFTLGGVFPFSYLLLVSLLGFSLSILCSCHTTPPSTNHLKMIPKLHFIMPMGMCCQSDLPPIELEPHLYVPGIFSPVVFFSSVTSVIFFPLGSWGLIFIPHSQLLIQETLLVDWF